ncbi:MAG: methyltransferase [Bryobacterales bacterium]|nr:methyltransferase [Bryobacterales bacterium]
MPDLIGTAPISKPAFILGKLSVLACYLFFLVKIHDVNLMLYDGPANRAAAIVLLLAGLVVMALALMKLGSSTRVGLSDDITSLRTTGIYRISRNPVYLGGFALCLASCSYSLHWMNFLFAFVGAAVHHRIVLAEERFLEAKFGDDFRRYRGRVRRYL